MATKLKPCPFCGGEGLEPEIEQVGLTGNVSVVCQNCGARVSEYYPREIDMAIEAWNTRTK